MTSGFECLMRHGGDGDDGAAEEQAKQGSQGKGKEGRGTKATDAGAVLLVLRRRAISDRVSFTSLYYSTEKMFACRQNEWITLMHIFKETNRSV